MGGTAVILQNLGFMQGFLDFSMELSRFFEIRLIYYKFYKYFRFLEVFWGFFKFLEIFRVLKVFCGFFIFIFNFLKCLTSF